MINVLDFSNNYFTSIITLPNIVVLCKSRKSGLTCTFKAMFIHQHKQLNVLTTNI